MIHILLLSEAQAVKQIISPEKIQIRVFLGNKITNDKIIKKITVKITN